MAEFFDGQNTELFEVSCHTGGYGGIIIPINIDDKNTTYLSLSPLEAKDLIALLQNEIIKYKEALDGSEENIAA